MNCEYDRSKNFADVHPTPHAGSAFGRGVKFECDFLFLHIHISYFCLTILKIIRRRTKIS